MNLGVAEIYVMTIMIMIDYYIPYNGEEIYVKENICNLRIVSQLAIKYLCMTRVLICFYAKTKDLLENVHKWPAKHENVNVFFCTNFPSCSTLRLLY